MPHAIARKTWLPPGLVSGLFISSVIGGAGALKLHRNLVGKNRCRVNRPSLYPGAN
jgi:hypothetical protein